MRNMPAASRIFMKRFCNGDSSGCAWFFVYQLLERKDKELDVKTEAILSEALPSLLPNQLLKVKSILQTV
jgi:hypothetical protein